VSEALEEGLESQRGIESIKASLRLIQESARHALQYIEEGDRGSKDLRRLIEQLRDTTSLTKNLIDQMPMDERLLEICFNSP
jgi:hypothetical protein